MVAAHDPHDEPFFREWNAHRHLTRSRARTTQLQHELGLTRTLPVPAILIIGSKGKGTATAAATSALAKNATVGTITSPPLRHNRERIRINGRAISHAEYACLSEIAHTAIDTLPPVTDGYLPPSGIYTQVGIAYLLQQGVDAGRGQRPAASSVSAASVMAVRGGRLAQLADGGQGVVGPVDGRPGDEDVRPGLGRALNRLGGDAAIDLYSQVEPPGTDQLARPADLGQHRLDEGLAPEARLHGHEQEEVELP